MDREIGPVRAIVTIVVALVVLVALSVGGVAGCKSFNRTQRLADVRNQTRVVHQEIKTAQQQALVTRAEIEATKAEAEKRYQESVGIRRAQDEIAKTLTPLYVQHEAIQKLPEARAIYVPSGNQGIPNVFDVGKESTTP